MIVKPLTFLKQLPITAYLVLAGITTAGGWLALNNAHQRTLGAEQVLRHTADSLAVIAKQVSDSTIAVAERAVHAAVAERARALAQVARSRAVQVATDSVARLAAAERDTARALLADSLATVAQLRGQVGRLIVSGVADSVAHAKDRASSKRTIADLLIAIDADTVAIRSLEDAVEKAIGRAVAAGRVAKLGKAPRNSLLSRCGAIAGYGGVLAGGTLKAGPAVTVGCRVFPW